METNTNSENFQLTVFFSTTIANLFSPLKKTWIINSIENINFVTIKDSIDVILFIYYVLPPEKMKNASCFGLFFVKRIETNFEKITYTINTRLQ